MLNFMAQVRKPLHSLVFVEDSLGRVMERLESDEVEWAFYYCHSRSAPFSVLAADHRPQMVTTKCVENFISSFKT